MDNLLCGPPGLTISDSTRARVASRLSGGICGWIGMIGRCLRGNLKELFPLAMMPGVDGFRAEIQLTWDEFSRMRHSLIDPLHFLLFTLFGAGLLPLPAANCQSLLSLEAHIFANWHLQSWSCFPVGLHHLLVVRCGLLATFSGKRRRGFETNISGCGRLLGRSCYGWLGSGQTFQSQTRTRSKDVLVTSGVAQGIKQRCNVAR